MSTPSRTEVETALLVLGKIAAVDQWAAKPDAAMAVAWAECFAVYGLGRKDLLDAVTRMYADDKRDKANRTIPADVIAWARKLRDRRAEAEKASGAVDREALTARRRAIEDCRMCDPSGWIETSAGLTRCGHGRQITA